MFESEEYQIADRIKDFIRKGGYPMIHIMLRNGRILVARDYRDMVDSGKVNPQDAYVYFDRDRTSYRSIFYYPFLFWYGDILDAYLSKLGFYYGNYVFPATGLKYVAFAVGYENYLAIEVINLDMAVNNTNLRMITFEVLDGKLISGEKELTDKEYDKIYDTFKSQKLFAGHYISKAWSIINDYYDEGNQSIVKEVARIAIAYVDIFHPYRVCYDMDSWKEIDCLSIKL